MYVIRNGVNGVLNAEVESENRRIRIDFGDGSCDYVLHDNMKPGSKYMLCTPTGRLLNGTIADLPWLGKLRGDINTSNKQILAEMINAMPKDLEDDGMYYKLYAAEYEGKINLPTVQQAGSLHNFCQYFKSNEFIVPLDSETEMKFSPNEKNNDGHFVRKDILAYAINKGVWADSMGEYGEKLAESVRANSDELIEKAKNVIELGEESKREKVARKVAEKLFGSKKPVAERQKNVLVQSMG